MNASVRRGGGPAPPRSMRRLFETGGLATPALGVRVLPLGMALLTVPWLLGLACLQGRSPDAATVWLALWGTTLLTGLVLARLALAMREQQRVHTGLQAWVDRFNAATDAGGVAVWEWNLRTEEVTWSPNGEHVYGLDPGDFDGSLHGWKRLVHPDDVGAVEEALHAALDGADTFRLPLRVVSPTGLRWIDASGTVYRDADGSPVRLVGTGVDITERKRAEEEAASSAAFLTHIVDSGPLLVWRRRAETCGADWVSSNAERITGYTAQALTREVDWIACVHPEDRATVSAGYEEAIREGTAEHEIRFRHADGRWLWLRRVLRCEGEGEAIIGYTADITAEREAEQRAMQTQKLEAIGRLVHGVAHDFNNLLTASAGYNELARRHVPEGSVAAEALDEQHIACEQATRLVARLQSFARAGDCTPIVVDVAAEVAAGAEILRRVAGDHISLHVEISDEPLRVRMVEGQLEQVVLTLAGNAGDAMPSGGRLSISVSATTITAAAGRRRDLPAGRYVQLSVSDSGCGIPPTVADHIFEPFFTTKADGHGLGLGLASVYGIVTQAGGRIDVDSEVDRGSTFTVLLPATTEHVHAEPHGHDAPTPVRVQEHRVLLVEDQDQVRRLLATVLTDAGYRVQAAADGHEALLLTEADEEPFDVLLTDVRMPQMSGPELAQQLCKKDPRLRVIYMSAYVPEGLDLSGVDGTPPTFLAKPFPLQELLATLQASVEGQSQRS